ncbi:MAG TPA: hypothetical protein VK745_10020 [Polyangiaceae bacterium]|nr:hypothetical protein [Polyangiaceae bacterium]
MSFAHRRPAESAQRVGVSPGSGRPLFVPPGLRDVRTGPTTAAELGRLLADADADASSDGNEVSQVRLRQLASPGSWLSRAASSALALWFRGSSR